MLPNPCGIPKMVGVVEDVDRVFFVYRLHNKFNYVREVWEVRWDSRVWSFFCFGKRGALYVASEENAGIRIGFDCGYPVTQTGPWVTRHSIFTDPKPSIRRSRPFKPSLKTVRRLWAREHWAEGRINAPRRRLLATPLLITSIEVAGRARTAFGTSASFVSGQRWNRLFKERVGRASWSEL